MDRDFRHLWIALCLTGLAISSLAQETGEATVAPVVQASVESDEVVRLEQGLQRLSWPQFKTVVMAIPKLRAEIDAYGAFGWQYVQANYATYQWRKSIVRFDVEQKQQLAELIHKARTQHKAAE